MRPGAVALGVVLSGALVGACAAIPALGVSLEEAVAFCLAAWWIVLLIRQSPWNWLFAILASGVYAVVFVQARLFSDAGLQGVYIALSVAGWVWWLRGGERGRALRVSRAGPALWAMAAAFVVGFTALVGSRLALVPGTLSFLDPFTTSLSLVGQFMQARKVYENWYVWILANSLFLGMYVYKGLFLTAVLSSVLLAMCLLGLREWRASLPERPR